MMYGTWSRTFLLLSLFTTSCKPIYRSLLAHACLVVCIYIEL